MAQETEKPVFVLPSTSRKAISLAMEGRWQEAVAANLTIIESSPCDVDAYNRLGRAYLELGEYAAARAAYSRAYEIDPYNSIAEKNLRRLSQLGEGVGHKAPSLTKLDPDHFIEEPGKAGVISLQQEAPREIWASIVAGEKVNLIIDGTRLRVENDRGEYLGLVDSRQSQRLIKLMKGGNRYSSKVVSTTGSKAVIIREIYKHPSQHGVISFPSRNFDRVERYTGDQLVGAKASLTADSGEEIYYAEGDESDEWIDGSDDNYDDQEENS
ncbi:MAG: tetratricopeptide repeat protein [Dehalococcoidales bacterium]|jgi:tetratricopeptide (TPR) repeat protein|nr:tetratricopeptide repeat protein [Dehalococcoidales bacterium]MDD3264713.1 tetratricopeptide repeat protein [Dehalococcoidales bacterium]MDD4322673.1 tetratricopeptide repeat protein [Dehalococcoidales bacterium]MDD4794309.1 tetratricopeptide repeat protein [Dehalococcoidales bacterium]MDD5498560.1 tetratricopeptide repeat protein [Dehalococcoidales bacterium]